MTLFVVVERRKVTGEEYISDVGPADGYTEYSDALADAGKQQEDLGAGWEVYVGRVVDAKTT